MSYGKEIGHLHRNWNPSAYCRTAGVIFHFSQSWSFPEQQRFVRVLLYSARISLWAEWLATAVRRWRGRCLVFTWSESPTVTYGTNEGSSPVFLACSSHVCLVSKPTVKVSFGKSTRFVYRLKMVQSTVLLIRYCRVIKLGDGLTMK